MKCFNQYVWQTFQETVLNSTPRCFVTYASLHKLLPVLNGGTGGTTSSSSSCSYAITPLVCLPPFPLLLHHTFLFTPSPLLFTHRDTWCWPHSVFYRSANWATVTDTDAESCSSPCWCRFLSVCYCVLILFCGRNTQQTLNPEQTNRQEGLPRTIKEGPSADQRARLGAFSCHQL